MIEMRREKRWPIELQLEISSLFKQDNVKVENINAPIEVFDVSKAGIGFRTKSVLNCVVRIIRQQQDGDEHIYGCEIVGTASIMDYLFNDYAASLSQ